MGIWDEYCVICGGPLMNMYKKGRKIYDPTTDSEIQIIRSGCDWLEKVMMITSDNQTIRNCKWNSMSSDIVNCGQKKYVITPVNYHARLYDQDGYGVVCHNDCYELIETKLKHKLVFANVCRMLDKLNCLLKKKSAYGKITKYYSQFFDYYTANKENSWLLQSPLSNKENRERILKSWTKLVAHFKKHPPRISPCESATEFKIGKVLIGFDGNEWVVAKVGNTHKWTRYNSG